MSEKKFNFVSPGIFLEEIDNSQLPNAGPEIGPVIIGRTERGPGMRPITVKSFSEYVELFGNPVPGGKGGDIFRDGNYSSPMYAGYAAQGWLRNNTPATIVRLLGNHHPNRDSGAGVWNAGWDMGNIAAQEGEGDRLSVSAAGGGAYGLFLFNSASNGQQKLNLGAVFYQKTNAGAFVLTGTIEQVSQYDVTATTTASQCIPIAVSTANRGAEFTAMIGTHDQIYAGTAEKFVFNFDENSDNYIRNVFNTNSTAVNTAVNITEDEKSYFLGETYERSLLAEETYGQSGSPRTGISSFNDVTHGVVLALKTQGNSYEWADRQREASAGRTGWFIGQDLGAAGSFKAPDQQKLFRLVAREDGDWTQKNLKVSIENIRPSSNKNNRYGTFTVTLRKIEDLDKAPKVVERFTSCDLNPNSANYVARKIGDKYVTWDETERRYRNFGNYSNTSNYVYVDMNVTVDQGGADDRLLPFGFFGPPKPKDAGTGVNIAATALLSTADGDLATANQFTEGEYVKMIATDGTVGVFILSDASETGAVASGTVLASDSDLGTGVPAAALLAAGTCIAVTCNLNTNSQATVLSEFKDTIASTNSPLKDKITGGAITGTGDGLQSILFTQATVGSAGNTAITTDISQFTETDFTGGGTGIKVDDDLPATDASWVTPEENNIPPVSTPLGAGIHTTAVLTTPNLTASFLFPKLPLKLQGTQGNLPKPTMQYWGIDLAKSGSTKYDPSLTELLRPIGPAAIGPDVSDSAAALEHMYVFTLDNLVESGSIGASYMSASRGTHVDGASERGSITSHSGSSVLLTGSNHGYNRFTTVFQGGFDGLDITEKDPFRNEFITANGSDTNNYAFYSIKRAIDSVRDAEVVEMNLATMPGITQPTLTEHLISTCEARGDALAIIDLEKDYVPPHENDDTEANNKPDVNLAVNTLKQRQINSSYGCAYFPWVQIRDTISNAILYVPPSVVALGTMGSSEAARELWFAPAGFTRGGLTDGASGLPVTGVKMHLSSDDRDKLYAANINPIASFPAEGIVIFGQKTLQVTQSALDRINVRRLLIFIKKQVSRIAATTLFEQNVVATWNGFKGQVDTFLSNVKGGLGLTDFRVVLDETTTTPELVDRNIMYAKVFLKPAQAIEFIALDFIITDSGASFDD